MANDNAPQRTTKINSNSRNAMNASAMANSNGDCSDNSAVSLGNNSFGFNFDEEYQSPVNLDAGTKSDEDNRRSLKNDCRSTVQQEKQRTTLAMQNASKASEKGVGTAESSADAASKVRQMQRIAAQCFPAINPSSMGSTIAQTMKRKSSNDLYKIDDEGSQAPANEGARAPFPIKMELEQNFAMMQPELELSQHGVLMDHSDLPPGKKKKVNDMKREERNAREKERSYRITSQINELRTLLSTGGVIVPKGTKNAVLTEAASYIRVLQKQQYKSEIHRHQLIQQMQLIGSGQVGKQAASAIRHVAAQNGVWSLGDFGGFPPRSAMTNGDSVPSAVGQSTNVSNASSEQSDNAESSSTDSPSVAAPAASANNQLMKDIGDHDYRFVFNSCAIGMAIASMGGAFIDCNKLFLQLSEYNKQEICGLTIFNMTAKDDLQNAFDLISQMISPPADSGEVAPTCMLRGNMNNRSDLGLSITLIKDDGGIAKCFCVTLIRNPTSQYEVPVHVTADSIRGGANPDGMELEKQGKGSLYKPAFMTG